jgi:hypothetical protein
MVIACLAGTLWASCAKANGADCFSVFGVSPGMSVNDVLDGKKVACTSKWNDLTGVISCEVGVDRFEVEVSSEDSGRIIHSVAMDLNWKRSRTEVETLVSGKCGSGDSWKDGDTRAVLVKDMMGYRFKVWKPDLYDWAVKTYTNPVRPSQPAAPKF